MRIVALSDIHGAYGEMERIISSEDDLDLVILAGDITTNGDKRELAKGLDVVRKQRVPFLAVCGNMDPPVLEEVLLAERASINGRGAVVGGVGFFGVSAAPHSFLHTPNEISEEEIRRCAEAGWKEVSTARRKIFVPHAPPARTKIDKTFLGAHVGSSAVREFIEVYQPDAVLCGHIHEARGTDSIGTTQVVNCGAAAKGYYAVIEVGETLTITLKP